MQPIHPISSYFLAMLDIEFWRVKLEKKWFSERADAANWDALCLAIMAARNPRASVRIKADKHKKPITWNPFPKMYSSLMLSPRWKMSALESSGKIFSSWFNMLSD